MSATPTPAMPRAHAKGRRKVSSELKPRSLELLKETDRSVKHTLEAEPVDGVVMVRSPGIKAAGKRAVVLTDSHSRTVRPGKAGLVDP